MGSTLAVFPLSKIENHCKSIVHAAKSFILSDITKLSGYGDDTVNAWQKFLMGLCTNATEKFHMVIVQNNSTKLSERNLLGIRLS